jgi:hypothetical protein
MPKTTQHKPTRCNKPKELRIDPRLFGAAERHGYFLLVGRGNVDIIDTRTGAVSCQWRRFPKPFFRLRDVSHGGGLREALEALISPYQLFEN